MIKVKANSNKKRTPTNSKGAEPEPHAGHQLLRRRFLITLLS